MPSEGSPRRRQAHGRRHGGHGSWLARRDDRQVRARCSTRRGHPCASIRWASPRRGCRLGEWCDGAVAPAARPRERRHDYRYGGDINRFVLKTEGEGAFGGALEDAEIQALYSRAIGPFFDLQAGVRFDPEPDSLTHLVLGVQGLAPYMFHVDGALFLSDRGDLTARVEAECDQKITQRLILQPRIEAEFAAQDIPEREIGAGVTKVEPGLRLRYEIVPEFAPYIGIEYEAKLGETADIARTAGEDPDGLKTVIGLRAWF